MFKTDFVVNAEEFFAAVRNSRTIKRSPAGGRSKIPKDTLITPNGSNKALVETPLKTQEIDVSGTINEQISLDAEGLEKIAKALRASQKIHIHVNDGKVFLEGNAKFSISIFESKK